MSFAERTVADITTRLPGATAVFRAHRIDFCCGGARPLAEAAAERDVPIAQIEAELQRLSPDLPHTAPEETCALIGYILVRYHEAHRRELPELLRLAARVETRHASHPAVPVGLHETLEELYEALDEHMRKEEQVLFPLMMQGGLPTIAAPILRMRHDHDGHGDRLRRIETLTHGLKLPDDACATWRALYAGLAKLADDLHEHVHLENNVLFARFDN